MSYETIIYKQEEGVAELTINRPEKMNALSFQAVRDCMDALEKFASDEKAKVLVITGAGEKAFSAGDDVRDKEWLEGAFNWTPGEMFTGMHEKHFWNIVKTLRTIRKPTIASVRGWCLASALEVAIACDIIIASDTAKFGMPFVNIGVVTGTSLLPRVIGYHKACEMLFTGEPVDAQEAKSIGLVNKVVPNAQLNAAVKEIALKLNSQSTTLLGWTKWGLNKSMDSSFADALDYEILAMALTHPSKFVPSTIAKREGVGVYSKKKE